MTSPFAWSANPARTVLLSDQALSPPRSRAAAPLPLRWPDKSVAAQLDFCLEASSLLSGTGDTLTATLNATTNVTAIAAPVVIGGLVVLWLAGGVAGVDGLVDLTLVAASGARARRIIRIAIV